MFVYAKLFAEQERRAGEVTVAMVPLKQIAVSLKWDHHTEVDAKSFCIYFCSSQARGRAPGCGSSPSVSSVWVWLHLLL